MFQGPFHETRLESTKISATLPENIFEDGISTEETDFSSKESGEEAEEEQSEEEEDEDEEEEQSETSDNDTSQRKTKCLENEATKKIEHKFYSTIKPVDRRHNSTETETEVEDKENQKKVKKRKFEDTEGLDHERRGQIKKPRSEKASSSGKQNEQIDDSVLESIENERFETVQVILFSNSRLKIDINFCKIKNYLNY